VPVQGRERDAHPRARVDRAVDDDAPQLERRPLRRVPGCDVLRDGALHGGAAYCPEHPGADLKNGDTRRSTPTVPLVGIV
jgi:hypothetical protein